MERRMWGKKWIGGSDAKKWRGGSGRKKWRGVSWGKKFRGGSGGKKWRGIDWRRSTHQTIETKNAPPHNVMPGLL